MPFGFLSDVIYGEQEAGDVGKVGERLTEEQKRQREQLQELVMERATREGPTAYEEAMLARAQEQAERQRRIGASELERALAQRGITNSGISGTAQAALARQIAEIEAEGLRNVMGLGQQRRLAYTGQAGQLSGQELQASTYLQSAQAQAEADAAAREQRQRMQLVQGLGTALGGFGQSRGWWEF